MNIVIALLVIAIVLVLLGALVKALLWLLFVGLVIAVLAFLYGAAQRRRAIDRR